MTSALKSRSVADMRHPMANMLWVRQILSNATEACADFPLIRNDLDFSMQKKQSATQGRVAGREASIWLPGRLRLTTILEVVLALGFVAYIFEPALKRSFGWISRWIDAVL